MITIEKHLIYKGTKLKDALDKLNKIDGEKILFIIDENDFFQGSITDGDIRRGLLEKGTIDLEVELVVQKNSKLFYEDKIDLKELISLRKTGLKVIPILNSDRKIVDLVNLNKNKSYLQLDTVIMAGGRGSRLSPLTDQIPKPLLPVGDKPIMEHNVDRLISFGIKDFWFSINYLKEQIKNHFKEGKEGAIFNYVEENSPMGTIGALSKIEKFKNKHILVTNSDLLTNLNYEDFYLDFLNNDADISMVTIPYEIVIPYGVVENLDNKVLGIKEKPTYTYYSNAGIYLLKKEVLKFIPNNQFFNATDLIEKAIKENKKVINFPFVGYWLDIGKHEDYKRAKNDFNNINLR